MKTIFRSVDFWKSAVMTMPDNSFFELLRSVFGKIKTPFNKQQLINDLEIFLLREDIQAAIAAYINENDAKVIAATALFGEPITAQLDYFFCDELSSAELQDIIVNLEERFILYRFTEDNISRLALNPVLKPVLSPFAANSSALFPTVSQKEAQKKSSGAEAHTAAPVLSDRILAGLFSFASQQELFFRGEGVIRKRIIEAGKTCFPGIDLKPVIGSLQMLGLFYVDGEKLVPDKKCFDDFGLITARERMEYCTVALLLYREQDNPAEILSPLYRRIIRDVVNLLHIFIDLLEAGILYPEKTLKKMIEIIKSEIGIEVNNSKLLEALEKTGLLIAEKQKFKKLGIVAHNNKAGGVLMADANVKEKQEGPFIAIDSGFNILVYPEISYTDAIALAAVLNIREAGAVVRFELDRESAVRSFDKNIRAEEIIELLTRLSGGRVDDALVWNLKDWEKRHGEVSLKKGAVLNLSQERRYLAETFPLANMIEETLAPGLYLLGENAIEEAAAALHSAGIDIIGRSCEKAKASSSISSHFPSLSSNASIGKISATPKNSAVNTERAAVLSAGFHAILKKMPLGETEKAELSARIDRRMVLCETQLKDANLRYEKLEARHMDYAGKQNIAKQAISQQSPVEIIWLSGKKDERIFGIPKTLEKEGGELVFVIVPTGKEDLMRIPLGKISLLRRIKKSIFEK